jgi:hypothetical protein
MLSRGLQFVGKATVGDKNNANHEEANTPAPAAAVQESARLQGPFIICFVNALNDRSERSGIPRKTRLLKRGERNPHFCGSRRLPGFKADQRQPWPSGIAGLPE